MSRPVGRVTTMDLPPHRKLNDRAPLSQHGIRAGARCYRNPTTSLLYAHALAQGDGRIAEGGPLVVDTGKFTGRSPKDKFVVREPSSEERIWWGDVNQEISERHFEGLRGKVASHLEPPKCSTSSTRGPAPTQRTASASA